MRILYIYDGAWPQGATRVRKQTQALAAAGHDVLLLARSIKRRAGLERETWMETRALPTVIHGRFDRFVHFPFFLNPLWIREIWRAASQVDAILVEDLPLAPTAIAVGNQRGLPVFYDMGEVYPEFLRGLHESGNASLTDHVIRNPRAAEFIESVVLSRADRIFVVSEESLARALVRGADPRRVVVVGNTPEDLESLTSAPPRPPDLQRLQGRPIVLFTGILIFDRGIVNAVRAIDEVRLEVPNVAFVIVGDGPDAPMIRDEIARLNLQHHVFLLGWQEHATLPAYYAYASVGLLPFLDRGQIRTTLANKLFDYMGAALPVIASDVPPMRRILEESGAGVLVRPNDTSELGSAIVRLLRDDQLMESMGRRGRSAVVSKYNWTVDRQRFVDAIADVFHPPPARPD